jgi:hypothetical protein
MSLANMDAFIVSAQTLRMSSAKSIKKTAPRRNVWLPTPPNKPAFSTIPNSMQRQNLMLDGSLGGAAMRTHSNYEDQDYERYWQLYHEMPVSDEKEHYDLASFDEDEAFV